MQGWYASSDLFPALLVRFMDDRLHSGTDSSGTGSTAGLKDLNTFLTGRDNLIKEANALQLTLSESWVSFMSSSFT